MIAIIDYGVGNLFSLKSSFSYIGKKAEVTNDPEIIAQSDRIILPGVGAFADAAEKLIRSGLTEVLESEKEKGKPLLGICLGMQLLFEESFEYGRNTGLSFIKGSVQPIQPKIPKGYKIPHIGWNALSFPTQKTRNEIFKYTNEGEHVYFVHSFAGADCDNALIATTEYGTTLTAAVADRNIYGTQFHPEKSGEVGLNILRAFCEV